VYSASPIAEAKLTVPGRARGATPATAPRPVVAWIAQGAAVAALLVVAMLARRPGWMLDRSYWLDEGWVADSLRAPLHQLLFVSSSTPIGWILLLCAVPRIGAPEHLRLLPLAFGVAGVVPAYLLGRVVGRAPAMAAGLAAAIGPVALMPHGLKQYTADAFVALLPALACGPVGGGLERASAAPAGRGLRARDPPQPHHAVRRCSSPSPCSPP
jgi:hypothetical protein